MADSWPDEHCGRTWGWPPRSARKPPSHRTRETNGRQRSGPRRIREQRACRDGKPGHRRRGAGPLRCRRAHLHRSRRAGPDRQTPADGLGTAALTTIGCSVAALLTPHKGCYGAAVWRSTFWAATSLPMSQLVVRPACRRWIRGRTRPYRPLRQSCRRRCMSCRPGRSSCWSRRA